MMSCITHHDANCQTKGCIAINLCLCVTANRFAFTYAWWSAYGYARHITSNQADADRMPLTNQESVYEQCGCKIKTDLMEGNAVVLFAYGLSGSGKTFTTFVSGYTSFKQTSTVAA
jgi:Kinesin motor domain